MTGKLKSTPIAAAIASAMFVGLAAAPIAQAQYTGSQNSSSGAQGRSEGTQQSAQSGKSQQASMRDMRASKLIGTTVRNAQGQDLGEVNDLVLDLGKGRVHYLVLERGGVLGVGAKGVAVPSDRVRSGTRDGELIVNLTEQQLKDAPGLESAAQWNDPRTWDDIGQYYTRTLGMPADQRPAAQAESRIGGSPTPDSAQTGTSGQSASGGGRFMRASDVIGMDVLDKSGVEVGEVEDMVVNLSTGNVHYAVLEFDRRWNPDDKLVALPVSAFQPTAKGKDLTISMTREQLANAPSFDTRQWPDLADSSFRNRVATFGRDTVGMDRSGSAPQGGASGSGSSTTGSQPSASGTSGTSGSQPSSTGSPATPGSQSSSGGGYGAQGSGSSDQKR